MGVPNSFNNVFCCVSDETIEYFITKDGTTTLPLEITHSLQGNKFITIGAEKPLTATVHSGIYTCTARNSLGEDSKSFTLLVKSVEEDDCCEPKFVKKLEKEYDVVEGERLQVETKVHGSPEPILSWKKNREKIQETNMNFTIEETTSKDIATNRGEVTSILTIYNYSEDLHAGNYECLASNLFGDVGCNFTISTSKVRTSKVMHMLIN